MKKIWIFLGIIAILLLIGYMYSQGWINVSWEWASIILAGLAGPFTYLQKKFGFKLGKNNKVESILQRQAQLEQELKLLRERYDIEIQKREMRIQQLQAELERLQDLLDQLELERRTNEQKVRDMSVEQKQSEMAKYFS